MQWPCCQLRWLFPFRALAAKPLPGRWPWNPLSHSCLEECFYFIFFFPACKQDRGIKKEGFRGLCLQRSYNTLCFPRHDTAWQNKIFILCTCQLRSAGSKMMKYYQICCCLFPLGTCADLFKVLSAPSKCFIYYSWHLKMSEGNVSRHCADTIFFICCCLLMS